MEPRDLYPKQTAAILRRLLRANFPACKFSVVTERGSMVSSVRIGWTDGPTVARVEQIASRFEAGHFDGMTDCYDYADTADRALLIDGVFCRAATRYVFCNRTLSPAYEARVAAELLGPKPVPPRTEWGRGIERGNGCGWYDFQSVVWQAAGDREQVEDRCRFDAHAWVDAIRSGARVAPSSVCYTEA